MKRNAVCTLLILLSSFLSYSQKLTAEELKLYNLLMEYRKEKGLASIPVSSSLTYVAQTHVKDLADNKPDLDNCNSHSWSKNGKWTSCCYTGTQSECMRNKPKELTVYKGTGYEIAVGSNDCCPDYVMTADYAISSWKKSEYHSIVIVNEGMWSGKKWGAVGIGLYKGFAVVWFGEEADN